MKHLPVGGATAAIMLNLLINIFRTEGPLHKATEGQPRRFSGSKIIILQIQHDTSLWLAGMHLVCKKGN
jgi:hypothetical protein